VQDDDPVPCVFVDDIVTSNLGLVWKMGLTVESAKNDAGERVYKAK
jgi:hypothetical protein